MQLKSLGARADTNLKQCVIVKHIRQTPEHARTHVHALHAEERHLDSLALT